MDSDLRQYKILHLKQLLWWAALLPVYVVLGLLRRLGELTEDWISYVDGPRYRWGNQADDIRRGWAREARRKREAEQDAIKAAQFSVAHSMERNGWCVFKRISDLESEIIRGPYATEQEAIDDLPYRVRL